jgi:hypothetical protein
MPHRRPTALARLGLLLAAGVLVQGCDMLPSPGTPLRDAELAEGPVLLLRDGHYYLRYRRALPTNGPALALLLVAKKTPDAGYYYFSVAVSHTEWGNRFERPLAYDGLEDLARAGHIYWLDPDGTRHAVPVEPDGGTTPPAAPAASGGAEPGVAPGASEIAWARLTQVLPGTWTTASKNGPFTVTYKLISGGHALLEQWGSGGAHETATVFHRDHADVLLTHYCAQGNQPRLRAVTASNDTVTFRFVDVTNRAPDQAMLIERTLHFPPDAFDDTEVYRTPDGQDERTTYHFERMK